MGVGGTHMSHKGREVWKTHDKFVYPRPLCVHVRINSLGLFSLFVWMHAKEDLWTQRSFFRRNDIAVLFKKSVIESDRVKKWNHVFVKRLPRGNRVL